MLDGPNLTALEKAVRMSPISVIASGGVARVEDIHAVKQLGPKITGMIVGKALYEGTMDLSSALKAARVDNTVRGTC